MSIKDEVRASAEAHRDLGPGYDTAVAEGLVERIGEEIDKRVDARLSARWGTGRRAGMRGRPPRPVPGRIGFGVVVLAMARWHGHRATAVVLHPGDSAGQLSAARRYDHVDLGRDRVINVAYARHR